MPEKRILYVDDEGDIREIASLALGLDPELDVKTCDGGQQALREAGEWKPDLILLDVMMPGMDGPTTLKQLKSGRQTAAIPVVFITARTQSHEVKQLLSLGAEGVIPKPFDPMKLASEVGEYLRNAAKG